MNENNGNILLNSLRNAEAEIKTEIPVGYIEVKLSTKGKVGAPEKIHIRNFKVKDIIALSLSSDADIPARLVKILNEMILEDVDVAQWHENEIVELMLYLFATFYKEHLTDVAFPLTDADLEIIRNQENGEETIKDIKSKKYTPLTDIHILQDVDTYELKENFTSKITITNKKTGFHITFDYIKYGDQLIIKKWLEDFFRNEERRFRKIKDQITYNNNILNRLRESPEDLNKLISIDPEEEEAYNDFTTRKLQTLAEVVRLISVVDYNGQDVSKLSLSEKYELMSEDPRIDYGLVTKLTQRQQKMPFGVKPEVRMKNPITGEVCSRPYSFRIPLILQAMSVSGSDDYDDGYDDEN